MAEGETTFVFKANTKPAEDSLDQFGNKAVGVGKTIGTAFAGLFAASKALSFLQDSIDEAVQAEKAIKEFNFALKATGVYSEQVSQSFQDYASSLQKVTGVQDEVILGGAQTLIQIGELSGDLLNRTLVASLDLAAARGIDASNSFDMLARAAQGNVMPFAKLGVNFAENATNAEKLNTVLGFIESKFSGAAKEATKGYDGAIKNLKNSWSDLLESFGSGVTQSSIAINAINGLADSLKYLVVGGSYANALFKNMIEALLLMGKVGESVIYAISRMKFSTLGSEVSKATSTYAEHVAANNALITSYDSLNVKMTESTIPNFNKLTDAATSAKYTIDELRNAQALYEEELSKQTNFQNFVSGFNEGMKSMAGTAMSLGKTVSSTFANGMTNSFAAVGKALVKGENALGAFAKGMLSTLGTIAIQMGQFLMLAGLGFSLLPGGFSAAGAIAAGLGLTVLGGVLQALGGGGETPAAGGGGGTVGAGGTTSGSMFDIQTPEEERAKAETGVQIVVQGNIFDSKETGLQIANILNESFDTNGTIVRAFA